MFVVRLAAVVSGTTSLDSPVMVVCCLAVAGAANAASPSAATWLIVRSRAEVGRALKVLGLVRALNTGHDGSCHRFMKCHRRCETMVWPCAIAVPIDHGSDDLDAQE